jgi:hypothetical protein
MFKLLVLFLSMAFLSGTIEAKSALGAAKKVSKKITAQKIEQKICPVMGEKINPKLYYKYKNQKIYVCCAGCISVIKKNPEKYLKKVKKDIEADKKKVLLKKKTVK